MVLNQLKKSLSKDKSVKSLSYKLELTEKEVLTLKDLLNLKDVEIDHLKDKIKTLEKENEDLLQYP
tara:strand:+ start:18 stop:215 length:198 start_codon:yes stop_codon:yes gene_type:complete